MQMILQKSLIIIIFMAAIFLLISFIGRAKKSELLLQMIMNISRNLDKLDTGLDKINSKTELAKKQLKKIIELNHLRILNCIFNQEQRNKINQFIKLEMPRIDCTTQITQSDSN